MKYLIGLILTIAVIIFIIIKLLTGGGGGGAPSSPPDLTSYADTDTTMRFTIQNPVQNSDTHREIQITVGKDDANLTVYRGYGGDVVRSKSYPMNSTAYSDFLHALKISGGYMNGDTDPKHRDERGYCATGDRFIYEIVDGNGNVIQHYWTTSCGGPHTYQGDDKVTQQLFELQIPDYEDLTNDVDLSS